MKNLSKYINEKLVISDNIEYGNYNPLPTSKPGEWIAIEVTTSSHYSSKPTTTQRIVTLDTYNELRSNGYTRGRMTIDSITKLGPVCKSRQDAMNYLDPKQKQARKSKIDKEGADYVVWAMTIGTMNPGGKTIYDWNFWDVAQQNNNGNNQNIVIYVGGRFGNFPNCFLWGVEGSFKAGDTVCVVDNDTQKKFPGAPKKILAVLSATSKDEFVKEFRQQFPDRCKPPKRSFGRVIDGIPWKDFGQIYSIKGFDTDA